MPKLSSAFNLDLNELKHEYLSERIAEIIYLQEETQKLFLGAAEKAKYMSVKNQQQSTPKF